MVLPHSLPLRRYTDWLVCDIVQNPPTGPFCSDHLKWYSESCWIPSNRLDDFLEGEEHRPLCNTTFKTVKTEEKFHKTSGKRLQTKKRYHCSYGPLDYRDRVEKDLPSKRLYENGKKPLRHTTLTGKSARRGCTCHFYITSREDRLNAVQITWISREHVDHNGNPCHGFADKTAEFDNAHVAPHLSRRTWSFIERLVRTGLGTTQIILAHFKNLRTHWRSFYPNAKEENMRWTRDMMLTPRDVKGIRLAMSRKKADYNSPDHLAVHTWTENNKEKVFLYQQKTDADTPFLLAWASEWQIEQAATLGHGRPIAMDATFGTNAWDLSLFTVLAYDEHQNGIPIAWALMEKAQSVHIKKFLNSLKSRVEQARKDMMLSPEWKPICVLIDVASEEILAIKFVWPDVPIILCFWHVRRAWTKNLISKVKDAFHRADMNRELKDLMYNAGDDPKADSEAFMSRWAAIQSTFVEYFRTYWHGRIERWMKKFRNYAHCNQNTNGALERWHHSLKMHLRTEKATKSGRSVIWLLGMLSEDMENFYWCMTALKHQGAIRNKVKEGYVFASIHKARSIADEQVTYLTPGPDGDRRAEVRTYKEDGTEKIHLITNYHKDDVSCTCGHSEQGNTCKHQIKLLLMDGYDEMKLFNLLGTKWGSLCGGLEYEYETMAGEAIDGENEVIPPDLQEVDICFPLRSFTSLEKEDVNEEDDDVPYHSYSAGYYVGLVEQGCAILEEMSCQIKNQAVVRLKAWLEWLRNEQAISDPAALDEFPMTAFTRPEGAETTLKRKKDHIERFWDKQPKGTRGKPRKSREEQEADKKKKEADKKKKGCDAENGWDVIERAPAAEAQVQVEAWKGPNLSTEPVVDQTPLPLPFVQKKKRKETDQQMLDRLARESINLNTHAMDYEAVSPPGSLQNGEVPNATQTQTCGKKGSGKAKRRPKYSTTGSDTSIVEVNTTSTGQEPLGNAQKRRGRPPGSKNKAKALTCASSILCGGAPLGPMSANVLDSLVEMRRKENAGVTSSGNMPQTCLSSLHSSLCIENCDPFVADGSHISFSQLSQRSENYIVSLD